MAFFNWLFKNTLFIHYLTLVIVIVGIASLLRMKKEARPNVNFNRAFIQAIYPGASPSDIEELVIDPIEEKISEVDGVEDFRSVSYQGAGSISVKIDEDVPSVDKIVDDVRQKVSEVKDLPQTVENPIVSEAKAINIPIVAIALYGKLSPFDMKLEVEKLKSFLTKIPGVQKVSTEGIEDLQLQLMANPEFLNKYDVTLLELDQAINRWTKELPGGLLQGQRFSNNLTVGENYDTVESIKGFILRSNDSGKKVRVSQLANVDYEMERSSIKNLYRSDSAVTLTVIKKPTHDIVKTVNLVKDGMKQYKNNLPEGLSYEIYNDQATRVNNRLNTVFQNAIFGLILVLILLILFLDVRSAIVTTIGIPVALLGGIFLLYIYGSTMNSLVLVGMIVVLGMLVDDAIVVCENIYYYVEQGIEPQQAALQGVLEIGKPVVATVLTTVMAFMPVLFMKGIMGQFISVIPLTVILLLCVSLFEALLILPVHASEIMKVSHKPKKNFFKRFENLYTQYLNFSTARLKNIGMTVVLVLVFVVSGAQGKKLFDRFTLFPATGLEGVSIRVELEKNTSVIETTEKIKILNTMLEEVAGDDFEDFTSTIGSVRTGGATGSQQIASHLGQVGIFFTSDPTFLFREKSVLKKIKEQTNIFAEKYGAKTSLTIDRPGPPVGKPIQFEIASRDIDVGYDIAQEIQNKLGEIDGVVSIENDLDGDSVNYRYKIDNERATAQGISPQEVAATIFMASTGKVATEILKNNEKVEVLVSVDQSNDLSYKDILKLKIRNKYGQSILLSNFVTIAEEKGPSTIQRLDGVRTVSVFAEVEENKITGKEANKQVMPTVMQLQEKYPNVKINFGGGAKRRMETLQETLFLFIFSIIVIFMIISVTFNSFIYPFLVLLTIPMGLCGVVWALTLHGKPFTLMGIIGVIGLSGVVVNISIILMKFMQENISKDKLFKDAVKNASVRRLRPIVVTTITTIIGLLPTMYGLGGVDSFVQPLALVMGWGLFGATLLSLLFLPSVISLFSILKPRS